MNVQLLSKNLVFVFCLPLLALLPLVTLLDAQTGVVLHDRQKTDDCFRLVSSRNLEAAHLITPLGRYIHSWHYPVSDTLTSDFGGFGMTWHYAEMLPNGNILVYDNGQHLNPTAGRV